MSRRLLAALLAALGALQLFALLRAPALWLPASVTVTLERNAAVTLAPAQLGASGAAPLALRRDAHGAWRIGTDGPGKPPLLRRGGRDERPGTMDIATVPAFTVGGAAFRMEHGGTFTDGRSHWRYDGATVHRDGTVQAPCPGAPLSAYAVHWWNRAMPHALTIPRPLTFGGNLHCGNRFGVPGTEPSSARIAAQDGALMLSGAASARDDERELRGVTAMTVGRTRYTVALEGDALTLSPIRHVSLHATTDLALPPQVAWQWQQRDLWRGSGIAWAFTLPAAAALLAALLLAPPPRPRGNILRKLDEARRHRSRAAPFARWLQAPAAALVLAAGIASLVAQRTMQPPSAACALLLASCALAAWLPAARRPSAATSAALLLIAAGLLCQLDLGLAGLDTDWLRYYRKTSALLAIGSGAIALWRCRPRCLAMPQTRIEWLLAALAAAVLLALGAQVLWGDETGVFDLQPVEAAKLVLTLLTAHCLALRMGWHDDANARPGHGARWLRLIAPALLFLALLGCALVQVDDYSPLVLLALWTGAMLLAYALAARCWVAAALLGCAALAGVAGVAALREAGPDSVPASFYGDRFQVWLEPSRHPHTGQQLQEGAAAVAAGGWTGSDGLFGIASLGRTGGNAMALPAVQDDFAPSFLLHRHGLLAGLLLWGAQAALVVGLVHAALAAGRAGATVQGFRAAWLLRLRAFALCGGAAFVAGHLLLSWGTNLAILPVMGQPMSFLSAGGSHLLFFLLPLLGLHDLDPQQPPQE